MKPEANQKYTTHFLFFILFFGIAFFLEWHKILFYSPQGIHFIRQTDSLAFALNYFRDSRDFLSPATFNLQLGTDGNSACEFPILYYITAKLYSIFDEQESILRIIHLLINTFGLFVFYKLAFQILKDRFYALITVGLVFTSSVYNNYAINYLPDSGALGLTLIGWYFFFRYYELEKFKYLTLSFGFFCLASLIKVTTFINPITVFATLLFYWGFKPNSLLNLSKNKLKVILLFITTSSLVAAWNIFAIQYNNQNYANYFLTHPRPIWGLTSVEINEIWNHISHYWYPNYFAHSVTHLLLIAFVFQFYFIIKKWKTIHNLIILILTLGVIAYCSLFYVQFRNHDYYFLTILPYILLLFIITFNNIKQYFPRLFKSYIVRLIILIIVISGINYSKNRFHKIYFDNNDLFAGIRFALKDTQSALEGLNISKDATFIILGDYTPNGGLYMINRKGWNVKDTSEESQNWLRQFVQDGADYIIKNNTTEEIKQLSLSQYAKPIYHSKSFSLYKINK